VWNEIWLRKPKYLVEKRPTGALITTNPTEIAYDNGELYCSKSKSCSEAGSGFDDVELSLRALLPESLSR
jgi:hypothetical protein